MRPPCRAVVLASALALFSACGEEDTLVPFDVTLQTFSDCEQVGQGGVNCASEEDLAALSLQGRWIVDYRGPDTFLLLTEDGRTLPGVYFANDGRVTTRSCTGEGGICHFARVRSSRDDPQSGCARNEELVVDLTVDDDVLAGEISDVAFTAEGCGTPIISELLVAVSGTRSDETVPAREEYAP